MESTNSNSTARSSAARLLFESGLPALFVGLRAHVVDRGLADADFAGDTCWSEAFIELKQDAGAIELAGGVNAFLQQGTERLAGL